MATMLSGEMLQMAVKGELGKNEGGKPPKKSRIPPPRFKLNDRQIAEIAKCVGSLGLGALGSFGLNQGLERMAQLTQTAHTLNLPESVVYGCALTLLVYGELTAD